MANRDTAFGLRPIGYLNGTPWNGKVTMYYASGGAIYKGSPVKHGGSGDTLGEVPSCAIASASSQAVVGVAIGFGNTKMLAADVTDLDRLYKAASESCYVAVVDDPNVVFEAQEDNASASLAAANIGQGIKLASIGSGSTVTGLSSAELDSSSANADASATYPFKILGIVDRVDNAMGSYCKWKVMLNSAFFKRGTVGA